MFESSLQVLKNLEVFFCSFLEENNFRNRNDYWEESVINNRYIEGEYK